MADQLINNSDIITGACLSDDGGNIDCPPGYTYKCCLDTTVDYPLGQPVPTECRIVDNPQNNIFSIEVINNRVWSCGNSQIKIHNKDGTLYKTISSGHSGYTNKTSSIACGHVTVFGDKVMIGSNILQNGTGPTGFDYQYWVPIYSLDGDFLEFWELGDFWHWSSVDVNVPNKSCNVEGLYQNAGVVAISSCGRRDNRAGAYEYGAIVFDYYGNIVDTYRTPWNYPDNSYKAYDGLTRVGDKIWMNNYYGNPCVLNLDLTVDFFLSPPCIGDLQGWSSAGVKTLDRTDGTPYVVILNDRGNTGTKCYQSYIHLYNYDGTHYMSIFVPDPQDFDCPFNESKFGEVLGTVDRVGDTLIVAAPNYGPNVASVDSLGSGKVFLYDITTGGLKTEIGLNSLPYPAQRHQLGVGVKLFNDEIWMYADGITGNQYIKICKVSWI